jgi:hypothetical protein
MTFPTIGENKIHVPNHQLDNIVHILSVVTGKHIFNIFSEIPAYFV